MILAGDIGGTHARLAYVEPQNGHLHVLSERIFPSRQYRGLGDIVSEFLSSQAAQPEAACFGIAGPVRNGRVETSNLPWVIEQPRLAKQIAMPATLLINDLEANAWGIAALGSSDLVSLNHVSSSPGNQAVIAPGTGLGEAGLYWSRGSHQILASEGGHADFAPRGELQTALLQFLEARYGHVSYERILSGPGLVNVFEFLSARNLQAPAVTFKTSDPAAISNAALDGSHPIAAQALDLWISVYGAEAGNLALKFMATGGVYLAGGISPKILPRLQGPLFMQAFIDKGRLRPLLESIPVHVITNDQLGLLGAARCASETGRNGDSGKS